MVIFIGNCFQFSPISTMKPITWFLISLKILGIFGCFSKRPIVLSRRVPPKFGYYPISKQGKPKMTKMFEIFYATKICYLEAQIPKVRKWKCTIIFVEKLYSEAMNPIYGTTKLRIMNGTLELNPDRQNQEIKPLIIK